MTEIDVEAIEEIRGLARTKPALVSVETLIVLDALAAAEARADELQSSLLNADALGEAAVRQMEEAKIEVRKQRSRSERAEQDADQLAEGLNDALPYVDDYFIQKHAMRGPLEAHEIALAARRSNT